MNLAPCEDVKCGIHAFCKPNGQEAYCICEEGWTYNPNDLSLGCVGKIDYYLNFIKVFGMKNKLIIMFKFNSRYRRM